MSVEHEKVMFAYTLEFFEHNEEIFSRRTHERHLDWTLVCSH